MTQFVGVVVALFVFWLAMSGELVPLLVGAGVLSAVAAALMGRRMSVIDAEGAPFRFGLGALTYWPWLIREIAKSAWGVTKIIADPRLPISPTLVRVKTGQKTAVGRVVYANSITLTPGTISIELAGDEILVHALTHAGAEDLQSGGMDRRVLQFEGSA